MNQGNHAQVLVDSLTAHKIRPEWLRVDAAVKLFGISRSKLYELISDRRIKSFCLRERNKIKGIRLISFDSVQEFLEREAIAELEAGEKP
jgi:predicted DNA-binding transcriptional regulator AlpA